MIFVFKRRVAVSSGQPMMMMPTTDTGQLSEALGSATRSIYDRLHRDTWEYLTLTAQPRASREDYAVDGVSNSAYAVDGEQNVRNKPLQEALTLLDKDRWEMVTAVP